MRNIGYYTNRQKISSLDHSRGINHYTVMRVSQSPNKHHLSPSPAKRIVSQPYYTQTHPVSPAKVQYYSPVPQMIVPSQTYYATAVSQSLKQKTSKRQEPMQQYNVWEGYDSRKDLAEQMTAPREPKIEGILATQNRNLPKNAFSKGFKQPIRSQYYFGSQKQNANRQVKYPEVRRVSPARNYQYCFPQRYR